MIHGIMITNGGAHPAGKWAEATAARIIQTGIPGMGDAPAGARKFEIAIIELLEGHHAAVQEGERGKIAEIGHDRLLHPLDPNEHRSIEQVADEIIAASKGAALEPHFAAPEVRQYVLDCIATDFGTSIQVERRYHADRNPGTDQAKAFRAGQGV